MDLVKALLDKGFTNLRRYRIKVAPIRKITMNEIQEYDLVALTEDAIATHKVTHQQILLRRGQMGTVLMSFDNKAFLIDFTDKKGNTFAMETIEPVKLLRLINEPELVYS
jgi:hypothetical protein